MKPIVFLFLLASSLIALEIAKVPKAITLENEHGGQLDGQAFHTESIKDKIYILFYVDPDEKDLNEHVSQALKAQDFDKTKVGSIAIINMAATWLPNFAIASSLKEKQEQYPNTLYIKDLDKVLVREWGLEDDSSNVLLFNPQGELRFIKKGKLTDEEVHTLIARIKATL